jgi:Glycosyl transferase family 2
MEFAPIVVFAYNRPHYLLETLQSLQANNEAEKSKLFIYCDGPKVNCTEAKLKQIEQVHLIAGREKWCGDVSVIISPVNKGLASSIIEGVTEIVNKYGKVIILEDDLVVSEYFLRYMNEALIKYEHNDEIASVTGYNYPLKLPNGPDYRETFFIKTICTLGWGVWKRSWQIFNNDAVFLLKEIKSKKLDYEFNFGNTGTYIKMLKNVINGKVSSWGVRWYASVFLSDKLTLFPSHSLINHIGNDGTNVKVDSSNLFGNSVYNKPIIDFEDSIVENTNYRNLFSAHFYKYNRRRLNLENIKYYYSRSLFFLKNM